MLGLAWLALRLFGLTQEAFYVIAVGSIGKKSIPPVILLYVIGIGDLFTIIFLIGVKENPIELEPHLPATLTPRDPSSGDWKSWFRIPMFYQIGVVYMCTRVAVNISQLFMPFYLESYLLLEASHPTVIAEVPIVVMVISMATTLFLKKANKHFGRRLSYIGGAVSLWIGLAGLFFLPTNIWGIVFAAAVFLGIGTTTILVTAISMEADLVGITVQSGAFVYGAMSFTDKLANGILIEVISGYSKDGEIVRYIITILPASACLVAVLASFTIVKYYRSKNFIERKAPETEPLLLQQNNIINTAEES